jgi:cyanophycinase
MSRQKQKNPLRLESLESRKLFAVVDLMDVGGFCQSSDSNVVDISASIAAVASKAKLPYSYSLIGSSNDAATTPTPGLAMMGGGTNVDAAFAWLANRANGGDFVILSASRNNYGKYINGLATLDSVESLVVPDRFAAGDSSLANIVANAEAIFITGGDQANYIQFWANTALEAAIYTALARGAALGGSSAGLAVMGQVDYAALNDSTTSAEALANPTSASITLDSSFITPTDLSPADRSVSMLRFLDDTITDSHFMQRDRMGRTLAFMANADSQNMVGGLPRGIAINEQTALLIDGQGIATVIGNGYDKKRTHDEQQRSVYLFSAVQKAVLDSGPLSYQVQVQRLNYDPTSSGTIDSFMFSDWSSIGADVYSVQASEGLLSSTSNSVYGPIVV